MAESLKARYFEAHVREKISDALSRQRDIFSRNHTSIAGGKSRGAEIKHRLESLAPQIRPDGEGIVATLAYPIEIRFFDMKRKLNWKIYNRVLWGMAYKDLLQDIKYEFDDWIRKNYPAQLGQR